MIVLNAYLYSLHYAMPPMEVIYLGLGLAIIILVSVILLFQSSPALQRILLAIEERFQIFTYIYIPLGVLGLTIVVLRAWL